MYPYLCGQVVVVFFWNMLAGSFIDQWQYIINNPASLINTLGISIPQTATFFITYIVVAGIGKESVQFLRIIDLLVFWVRSMTASTPRARSRLWAEQYQLMGNMLPYFTMGEEISADRRECKCIYFIPGKHHLSLCIHLASNSLVTLSRSLLHWDGVLHHQPHYRADHSSVLPLSHGHTALQCTLCV